MTLSKNEVIRYSRHLVMPEVGMKGQLRLQSARVLLIGAGGLGSPLAMYLAAAGVGTIGIVDFDSVDMSNLQRQILHSEAGIGTSKLQSAQKRLEALNPHTRVILHEARFSAENAADLVKQYDIVADGTDNFPTRYLVNDACVFHKRPNVFGSVYRFEGQVSVFDAQRGPCYRCLFPEPPPPELTPNCAEGGVLGVLPGIVGTLQALEVIKLIIGVGDPLTGRLLMIDGLTMQFRQLKLRKHPDCPVCGETPSIREFIDYEHFCGIGAVADKADEISAVALRDRLATGDDVLLLDVREPHELLISQLPDALNIPMGQLMDNLHQLDTTGDIVVFCRSGIRSRQAILQLREIGFTRLKNLNGGILDWAKTVDPGMTAY